MRAWWLIIPAVVISGCDFGLKTCATNTDCPMNSTCDQSTNFCVRDPLDAGMTGGGGGGMTGGGGGTTGGGSTGGGMPDGGPDAGEDAGMDAGNDAGADSGVDAGVDAGTCNFNNCPVGAECVADMCTSVSLVIVQVGAAPTVGRLPVPVTGRIQRASDGGIDGFRRPSDVSLTSNVSDVSFPASTPILADSTFVFPVTSDAGSGPITINASATLGLGAANGALNVTSDTTPPNFLIVSSSLALPFKRDDFYSLAVDALEPLSGPVTVRFGGVNVSPTSTGCTGDAGCWLIDMSAPPLDAITENVNLVISGTDRFGNTGSATTQVTITRKRWEVQALPNTEITRASPAIGSDGTIYVGSVNGAVNAGSLFGIDPIDGGTIKTTMVPGAIQSLATARTATGGNSSGEEVVYFSANDTQGRLGARRAADLSTTGIQSPISGNGLATTQGALALLSVGPNELGAVAAFNRLALASRVGVFGPQTVMNGVNAPDAGATFDMLVDAQSAEAPNNILVDGTNAYFVSRPGGIGAYAIQISNIATGPSLSRSFTLAATGSGAGTTAQSWMGSSVIVGGMTSLSDIYRIDSSFTGGALTIPADNGASAIADAMTAYVGRGSDLVRYNPSFLGMPGTQLATGLTIRTSPILGAPRGTETALGYAVDSMGQLIVFPQGGGSGSASNWGSVFTSGGPVRAHPNLDCNRRVGAATSTTGILYVASASGRLAAIIVDSPRLLTTVGAWPKYQRTAANAGNTDNVTFPLNPGCPPP